MRTGVGPRTAPYGRLYQYQVRRHRPAWLGEVVGSVVLLIELGALVWLLMLAGSGHAL